MAATQKHVVCNKETDIEVIKLTLENQNIMLKNIHEKIVGNGHPGLIQETALLREKVKDHSIKVEKHDKVINKLELKMAFYAGVIVVVVFLSQYVADKLFK